MSSHRQVFVAPDCDSSDCDADVGPPVRSGVQSTVKTAEVGTQTTVGIWHEIIAPAADTVLNSSSSSCSSSSMSTSDDSDDGKSAPAPAPAPAPVFGPAPAPAPVFGPAPAPAPAPAAVPKKKSKRGTCGGKENGAKRRKRYAKAEKDTDLYWCTLARSRFDARQAGVRLRPPATAGPAASAAAP